MGEEVKADIFMVDENNGFVKLAETIGINFGISAEKCCTALRDFANAASGEVSIDLEPKTISKKRFIKLLMSEGYQRNDAIKAHNYYMEKYGTRNEFMVNMFLGGIF